MGQPLCRRGSGERPCHARPRHQRWLLLRSAKSSKARALIVVASPRILTLFSLCPRRDCLDRLADFEACGGACSSGLRPISLSKTSPPVPVWALGGRAQSPARGSRAIPTFHARGRNLSSWKFGSCNFCVPHPRSTRRDSDGDAPINGRPLMFEFVDRRFSIVDLERA